MKEFKLIAEYFAPLARDGASLGLQDDAAIISAPAGQELVITKDAIVEGVHFQKGTSPELIARKLLRVNLSDMAAMGATPYGYLLALILPDAVDERWFSAFVSGLKTEQEQFGITLLGGDTTGGASGVSLSATMLGFVPKDCALKRNGAKIDDDVYVSGTIGDGALGLKYTDNAYLFRRYQLPEPRVKLGEMLRGVASACMDISDGLVQDLGHIGTASGLGVQLQYDLMPVSDAAYSVPHTPEDILAGGDDYELLFTAPAAKASIIEQLAGQAGVKVTRIGRMDNLPAVRVLDAAGREMKYRAPVIVISKAGIFDCSGQPVQITACNFGRAP